MRRRLIIAASTAALGVLIGHVAGCSGGQEDGPASTVVAGPAPGPAGRASAMPSPSVSSAERVACDAARELNASSEYGDFRTVGELAAGVPDVAVHAAGAKLRLQAAIARSRPDVYDAYLELLDACLTAAP